MELVEKNGWYYISIYEELSEDFIEKYWDELDNYYISVYQKLSEPFIEKYFDKLNRSYISTYQRLSKDFIERHNLKIPEEGFFISNYLHN